MNQNAAVQELPKAEDNGVLNKNTGFPEPLSPDRNTTLPHPEADTSARASLESNEAPTPRSNSRRIPSFRHSHKGSSGKIVDDDKVLRDMYKDIQYADGSKESINVGAEKGRASLGEGRDSGVEGLDGVESREEKHESGEKKKKGFLKKLGLH